MSITITDAQEVQLTAAPLDAAGIPDPTAVISWTSDDPAVATIDHTGLLVAVGVGSANVTATATDVDGHTAVSAPFGVTVTGGDAATVGITAGTPVPKPPAGP